MKKTIIWIISGMAIGFFGWAGTGIGWAGGTAAGHLLVNPLPSTPQSADPPYGLHLTLSQRSSISIDLECILEHVKSGLLVDPTEARSNNEVLHPWINWNISF